MSERLSSTELLVDSLIVAVRDRERSTGADREQMDDMLQERRSLLLDTIRSYESTPPAAPSPAPVSEAETLLVDIDALITTARQQRYGMGSRSLEYAGNCGFCEGVRAARDVVTEYIAARNAGPSS